SSYSLFFCLLVPRPPGSTLFPYTTLFRSQERLGDDVWWGQQHADDETGHDHIGALGGQVLRRGGAGQNQQYRRNGDFKRNAEGKDRKSTRLNSSHVKISYAVFCLKKKKNR